MDQTQLSELIMQAIGCAVTNDDHGAATALQTIGQHSDDHQMYGVCCAIASAGVLALKRIYGEQAATMTAGDMWVLEELRPGSLADDPPKAFAMRFLISYANEDTGTCLALYNAALKGNNDEYIRSVCALLADVAGITRLALEQMGGR